MDKFSAHDRFHRWFVYLPCLLLLTLTEALSAGPDVSENCNINGIPVTGLRPDSTRQNCSKFWLCRVRDVEEIEPGRSRVEPLAFYCPDPQKPYFNHHACQCVSSDDNCRTTFSDKCVRLFENDQPAETCSSYGPNPQYYTDIFPHLENTSEFWSCVPTGGSAVKAVAVKMVCPEHTKFDLRSCRCEENTESVSHLYNTNPMNRYRCALPLSQRQDKDDSSDEADEDEDDDHPDYSSWSFSPKEVDSLQL